MGKTYWISWNIQKEHKRPYITIIISFRFPNSNVDIGGDTNTTQEEKAS